MKTLLSFSTLLLASAVPAFSQGAAIDWPSVGGDAQRTGWEKSDSRITKDNVKSFQLVMKMNLDPKIKGAHAISPPVVLGRLISYRGFKELAFVQSANDRVWAVDADMNRVFWDKHFEKPQHPVKTTGPNAAMCSNSVIAAPALTAPVAFGGRGGGRGGAAAASAKPNAAKSLLAAAGFGAARPVFALSSDGKLHLLNTSTGEDAAPAMTFLPNGAKASSLISSGGVVYTTTNWSCGGTPNGVWAIDLTGEAPKVSSFPVNSGGIAFGATGTIYAQSPEAVVALSAGDLKQLATFPAPGGMAATTPVLFTHHEQEILVAAGKDGTLYLLDPKTLTKISETKATGEIHGGLSSWQETDGTRWVLAPVSTGKTGAIHAFKLDATGGSPKLIEAWVSREMASPEPPVITSGLVFALATGQPNGHATLYALDGSTGKELYSSGDQVTTPANLTGVTLANGRVFFTTTDGTLYGFGIFLER